MRLVMIAGLSVLVLPPFLSQAGAVDLPEPHLSSPSPGILSIELGSAAKAGGIALQRDGTIVVAATAVVGPRQGLLLRITGEGQLAHPGITAIAAVPMNAGDVAIAPDDKIVVIGDGYAPRTAANEQSRADFQVARFLSDGTPDKSFAQKGWTLTDVGGLDDHNLPRSVIVQPDGRIVVAGSSNVREGLILRSYSFATARYDRDGSLDQGFGAGGRVITRMGVSREDHGKTVLLQPDGKLIVAGTADSWREKDKSKTADFALVRYLSDGRLDKAFGQQGKAGPIGPLGLGLLANAEYAAALDPSGRILVGGFLTVAQRPEISRAPVLARYSSDGTLDRSFGTNGLVTLAPGGNFDKISAVAVDADGTIIAAGRIPRTGCGACFAVIRLKDDGSFDHNFADSGFFDIPIVRSLAEEGGHGLAIQSRGKVVVLGGGVASRSGSGAIVLVRLNRDGSPDPTFGAAASQLR